MDFEDDGDKQRMEINALFSEVLLQVLSNLQQFCFSVAGVYASSSTFCSRATLSTRFPFHCQDRFIFHSTWGSDNEVGNNNERMFPPGPQMGSKSCQKSIQASSGGVSKRDLKKGPSPGSGKARSGCYSLHFSKVGTLEQNTFLGTILGTI